MSQISHQEFSLAFFLKYFIVHLDWYVFTTLLLYVLFWISISRTTKHRNMLIALCLLTGVFYGFARITDIPAHYYRNLWVFPLGVLSAVNPNWIKSPQIILTVIFIFVLNSISEGLDYTITAIMALMVLFAVGYTNKTYEIQSKFLLYIGGISYSVYLIHRTVYNMLWTYNLVYFPLFFVLVCLCAHIFDYVIQKKI